MAIRVKVKAAAASHLAVACQHLLKNTIVEVIIPTAQKLAIDSSEFVRSFFALEVNKLAPLLGRDETVQYLLPLLLTLLRDSNSEVIVSYVCSCAPFCPLHSCSILPPIQVRLNVISGLDSINDVIGIELLSQSLLPAVTELAQDPKWRVRLAVIENTPMLAKQLGVQFFNEKLINLTLGWLGDSVHSIRKAAAGNLHQLAELFGEMWTRNQIIPRIKEMHSNAAFSKRMTSLYALQVLIGGSSLSMTEDMLVPIIVSMTNDPVPNIRFTAAKALKVVLTTFKGQVSMSSSLCSSIIGPALAKLSADLDRDVRQHAEYAASLMK
jgi:serine/threonine-protein phosphatase 2A regulatory subunit A